MRLLSWIAAGLLGLAGVSIPTLLRDGALPMPDPSALERLEGQLAAPAGGASTSEYGSFSREGAPAGMPGWALPLGRYARYYAVANVESEEDLPFTTVASGTSVQIRGDLIVGVLVLPTPMSDVAPGVYAVGQPPQHFHGGCTIVNVVFDPRRDLVLATWCNYDDQPAPAPRPGWRPPDRRSPR